MAQAEATGIFQFLKWGSSPTGLPDTGLGIVNGGGVPLDPNIQFRRGIGPSEVRRGGPISPKGTADIIVSESNKAFLKRVFRTTLMGDVSRFNIAGGTTNWARWYQNAVLDEVTWKYDQSNPLTASIAWMAMYQFETVLGSAQPAETWLDYEPYEVVIAINGGYYGVTEFEFGVKNNHHHRHDGDPKETGHKRFPSSMPIGPQDVSISVTCNRPIPQEALQLDSDNMIPGNLTLSISADNAITGGWQLEGLMPTESPFDFVDQEDDVPWKYTFVGTRQRLCVTDLW